MLITILSTILVLGVLILVHELGHFWAAKAVDIEVPRFSIGIGPKMVGFKRGETEYVISWLPLGGYVKMAGMADEEVQSKFEGGGSPDEARTPSPRDFDAKPLWARMVVISAGVFMNMVFAFLVFVVIMHERGIQIPLIGEVDPDSPAEVAGLLPGDIVVAIDGRGVREWAEMALIIEQSPGRTIPLTVQRGESLLPMRATPATRREYLELAADTVELGRLGIRSDLENGYRPLGWGSAVVEGAHHTAYWVGEIYRFLWKLMTGKTSVKELGGPILIGQLSGQSARLGIWPLLGFMAIISVNLAILNMLPIPVLDGGHMFLLLLEGLRGKALTIDQRIRFSQVGLVVLIGIMILAFANDILRLLRGAGIG